LNSFVSNIGTAPHRLAAAASVSTSGSGAHVNNVAAAPSASINCSEIAVNNVAAAAEFTQKARDRDDTTEHIEGN